MPTLTLPAPAKLNLTLRVRGIRDDGMHLLDGTMILIDYADTVHLTPRNDSKIVRCWQHPQVDDNTDLALAAAQQLQAAAAADGSKTTGINIHIDKKIPVGGGLGGASSNAASVLIGLNRLWQLNWNTEQLHPIAVSLGADVPFFLHGKPSRIGGIGDVFYSEKIHINSYLLVFPQTLAITAAVFKEHDRLTNTQKIDRIPPPLKKSANDLTAAAVKLHPQIVPAAQALCDVAGEARLSGSGSTVFAAFADTTRARQAQQQLPATISSAVATMLTQHPAE